MTHNPAEQWIRSNEPAHEAIISPTRFDTVQTLRGQRARNHGRQERAGNQGARPYALRGRIRCTLCGRRMQPATIEALTHASAAASAAETHTPEQAQARQALKDCERRLARYQAALEAGADPAVVTQWINQAQTDKEAARKKLDALPALTRKKEPPLDAQQIRAITESLGGVAQCIRTAGIEEKGPLYEALGITISYEDATRTATVRSRPSSAYRQSLCPRGDLNPHAR
ncbi:hypothetical protein ACWC09_10835 [Streptomyces sp. NPDC001617]